MDKDFQAKRPQDPDAALEHLIKLFAVFRDKQGKEVAALEHRVKELEDEVKELEELASKRAGGKWKKCYDRLQMAVDQARSDLREAMYEE